MYEILDDRYLSPNVKQFEVLANRIARKQQPGQFVIIRLHDRGERIPLTIADSDRERGTIQLIVKAVGKTTQEMMNLSRGDAILNVVGPLGIPSHIDLFGTAVAIGGGVGAAITYPIARALKEKGNRLITILGASQENQLILLDKFSELSDQIYVTTDDGSLGEKGKVTDVLMRLIEEEPAIDYVHAVGPLQMMEEVSRLTKKSNIQTVVSLNPIMVDGTGMCGGCRVRIGGETRFACVDGPEFNAHEVDFKTLNQRNEMYLDQERESLDRFNLEQGSEKSTSSPFDPDCKLKKILPSNF